MTFDEKDIIAIKDRCLQYHSAIRYNPHEKDDRLLLAKCYTQAVVDILKEKNLLKEKVEIL